MKKFALLVSALTACSASPTLRAPSSAVASAGFADREAMTITRLKAEAFARCQVPYVKYVPEPVPMLDPPRDGRPESEGLVFQEELSVHAGNLLDRDGFYFTPRPRAAVNSLPMELFVDADKSGTYVRKTWEDANVDYSSGIIQPPIDRNSVPPAGRVLTELIIGHRSPSGDYPQLFDLRSSAYVRFAGYPPQVTGASLRLGAHKIFGMESANVAGTAPEDFPVIRAMFTTVKNGSTANALVLLESDLFCGALDIDMTEGANAELVVDGNWFTRRDFRWRDDPHTALLAYSSMHWKTQTNADPGGAAHDTDTFRVQYATGQKEAHAIVLPATKIRVTDFTAEKGPASAWVLANEDRDPAHYADFAPALGDTNYNLRVSYLVKILESNVKMGVSLYEQATDGEYGDNIVAASTIRQDVPKSASIGDAIHFKVRTRAYFPAAASPPAKGAKDQ